MARDTTALLAELRLFDPTKSASASPESATDPAESGVASAVPAELIEPSGADGNLEGLPDTTTMPGGISTVGEGDVSAPSAMPFTTSGKEAAAFQKSCQDLRSKLASFGATAPPVAAATPATSAAAPTKEAAADTTGFGRYHLLIVANLMKSASGRELMNRSLDEVLGLEAGRDLLKSAAAEQGEFEAGYLQEKIAAAEQHDLDRQQESHRAELAQQYRELTKHASAEDITKINQSLFIMKQAEEIFAANSDAHYAFLVGVDQANKFAAAMEAAPEGAAPPDAGAGVEPPEGPPSPEEIEGALMELVQAGVLTEEQAIQLLQQIAGGAEGGMPPGAEGGMPPGAEGMPPGAEGMPPEEVAKAAAYATAHLDKVATLLFQPTA
jgi:hypothetical protein